MTAIYTVVKYKNVLAVVFAVVFTALFGLTAAFTAPGDACNAAADCDGQEVCVNNLCEAGAGELCNGEVCRFGEVCGTKDGRQQCVTGFGVQQIQGEIDLGNKNLIDSIVGIINVVLGLLGIIAVVIILIAGFRWMTAGGNEDKVAEARKMIVAGIIGLAIILSAWAISRFVIVQLARATDSGDVTGFDDFD